MIAFFKALPVSLALAFTMTAVNAADKKPKERSVPPSVRDLAAKGIIVQESTRNIPREFYRLGEGRYDVSSTTGAVKKDCNVTIMETPYVGARSLPKTTVITDCVFNVK